MYSGLLPMGLKEDDISSDDLDDCNVQHEGEDRRSPDVERTICPQVDVDSSHATDQESESSRCSLPGISQEMWQKFQELQKKKNEITMTPIPRRRHRRKHKKVTASKELTQESREPQIGNEKHLDELKQYFGVNERFQPPACSRPPPKSGLEKSIESAIAEGDIAKAEEMSDRLATRELGVQIAQAINCRDFVQHKQEEEAKREAQKRKKQIAWGFEAKKRWETKSNMGYM